MLYNAKINKILKKKKKSKISNIKKAIKFRETFCIHLNRYLHTHTHTNSNPKHSDAVVKLAERRPTRVERKHLCKSRCKINRMKY